MDQTPVQPPLSCHRHGCVFHVPIPPSSGGPKEPCRVRNDCTVLHLQATTIVSIVCLVITALFIWEPFLHSSKAPPIPTVLIGVTYIIAILYFYIGALNIEDTFSPYFHKKQGFPLRKEFFVRCLIITLVVLSIGLAGTVTAPPDKAYSPLAMTILFGSQLLYLAWDLFVYFSGDDTIKMTIWRRFIVGDLVGAIAAGLIFWMASVTPPLGAPGSQRSEVDSVMFLAGGGVFAYLLCTLFGPRIADGKSWHFDGGIVNYISEILRKIRLAEFR